MRFVANENVSNRIISQLRLAGHDVYSVKESSKGASDQWILDFAQSDHRIVLTHDKDFGELAFKSGQSAGYGVILLRFTGSDRYQDAIRVTEGIASRDDWTGDFAVISDDRIRIRPLPSRQFP